MDHVIKLDQFLKLIGAVETGGQAKWLVRDGAVSVNGNQESRRGRQLSLGDVVEIDGEAFVVEMESPEEIAPEEIAPQEPPAG